jgi:hypothetical protein
MAINFEKAAVQYCNFRLITGSVIAGILGLLLFALSAFSTKIVGDTSSYVLTDATVVSATIVATTETGNGHTTTYFYVVYQVSYQVKNVNYNGTVTDRFATFETAKLALDAAKGSIKKIYYNPMDPSKSSQTKSAESILRWTAFGGGLLLVAFAVITFLFRNNLAFCAMTTASNVSSMFN